MTSFWLREAALSLAREKELQLALAVEKVRHGPSQWHGDVSSFSAFLSTTVPSTGAMTGCFRIGNGSLSCVGEEPANTVVLKRLLVDAQILGKPVRALSGWEWVTVVPCKKFLDLAVRFPSLGHPWGAVVLRYPLDPLYSKIRFMQRYIGIYLGVNLLILVVIGFIRFRRGILLPVEHLIRLTDSYTDESGVPFLALENGNELEQLAGSMQQMLGRIRSDREKLQQHVASLQDANQQLLATREEMVRTEILSSVGRLAAGLAHEIGNPVGIVQGYLGLIKQNDIDAQERQEFCGRAEQELERISHLVRQLLDLSRPMPSAYEDVDMHQLLTEVVELVRPQPLWDGIDVTAAFTATNAVVHGNAAQLKQVFLNCLINAADAIHSAAKIERGQITITTNSLSLESGQVLQVLIADTGTGLGEKEIAAAFDPFFTTKEPGKGTGLGLSVSFALLKAMNGTIQLANQEQGGAMVTITLPVTGC
jgi:signal transduction histidine kinase